MPTRRTTCSTEPTRASRPPTPNCPPIRPSRSPEAMPIATDAARPRRLPPPPRGTTLLLPHASASLWRIPAPSFAPLTGDRVADVVVVGAGIAGLTTAVELVRAGREVVVLEALAVAG